MRTLLRAKRSVLWLGDALVSVYVALLAFFRESGRDHSVFLQTLEHPLAIVNRALDRPFDFSATFDGIWHIQVAAAVLLAVIIFACVRACRWTRLTRAAVRYGVGLVAAVGPLYSPHFGYLDNSLWYDTIDVWTRIEVAMAAAYAVLYLHAKWAAKSDLAVVVLVLHLSFWGAVVWSVAWGDYFWRLLAFLLLPLGTLLCWGYDVRQSGALPPSTAPMPTSGE
jgi:hypothetical protein